MTLTPTDVPRRALYSVGAPAEAVTVAYGTDGKVLFLEFTLATGRSVRVETLPGGSVPEQGGDGTLVLSIDGGPAVELRIRGAEAYEQGSEEPYEDERLGDFYEPLRTLAGAVPPSLQDRIAAARSSDDDFWHCVGGHTVAGAEMGFIVGSIGGGIVGGPGGLAAGGVAGGLGGAAGGFLGGVATC